MNTVNWIVGLMRENYEAVGFIPEPTVRYRYIELHRYILQSDEAGRPVGYLLHGAIRFGQPVVVSQHVIDYDRRLSGYGASALQELIDRCTYVGASSIHVRCAADLPSINFWKSESFSDYKTLPGGLSRGRTIHHMIYEFPLPLFNHNGAPSGAPVGADSVTNPLHYTGEA